jgi:hypothetical protein
MKKLLCAGLMLTMPFASAQEQRRSLTSILAERALSKISNVVATQFKTPEAVLEEKIQNKEIDLKNLDQSFGHKGKTYKVSDFNKVIGDNIDKLFLEMDLDEAKQFAQNYMVSKSDILNSKTQSSDRTQALNNLNKMFGYIYADKGAEELAKILECKPEDELTPIADIVNNLQIQEKYSSCDDIKPGGHKLFSYNTAFANVGYLLNRKPDGTYQAVLNLDFIKSDKSSVSASDMFARSKECLASAARSLKGPKGEKFEISILTPDEANRLPVDQRPKANKINIQGSDGYSTALNYTDKIDCGTITHETFHLLGLCDEYDEEKQTRTDNKGKWNCRVITKTPNIMNDVQVFEKAVSRELTCECTENACKSVMKSGIKSDIDLYLGRDIYSILDLKFKNSYCKDSNKYEFNKSNWITPERAIVLKSEDELSFSFYDRMITNLEKPVQSVITCTCPAGDEVCSAKKKDIVSSIKEGGRRNRCPLYTKEISSKFSSKTSDNYSFKDNQLTFNTSPSLTNMMMPAHFSKVLYGNCPSSKASNYNQCADFAYKTESSGACGVPAQCLDDSYYLGVPK